MSALDRLAMPGYTEVVRSMRLALHGVLAAAAAAACACAPPPERGTLMDASVAAGAQIYPQLLARAFPADEEAPGVSARPQLAYLSRSLCAHGEPVKSLRLGPELQDLLTRSASQLGMEARWVDSRAVFEHAEAADSGDALLCFGAIELVPTGAQVEVSIETRDGSQEQATYAFRYGDGRWRIEPDEVETP